MILGFVKYRLGFALVVALAVVGTAILTGSSTVAAIVAVALVLVLGALLAGREKSSPNMDRQKRARGEPFSVSYRWTGDRCPDLPDLSQVLNREGLKLNIKSQSSKEVVLRGGSHLWTRLFGGYFVDHKRLPIQVELRAIDLAGTGAAFELKVRDRLGIAIRDEALEDRYAQAAAEIRSATEARLRALGGFEADAANPE